MIVETYRTIEIEYFSAMERPFSVGIPVTSEDWPEYFDTIEDARKFIDERIDWEREFWASLPDS